MPNGRVVPGCSSKRQNYDSAGLETGQQRRPHLGKATLNADTFKATANTMPFKGKYISSPI